MRKPKRWVSAVTALSMLGGMVMPLSAETTTIYYGDVNGDGSISVVDLTAMKQALMSGATQTDAFRTAADVNADGAVTVADAVLMQQYLATILDAFPAGVSTTLTTTERYYAVEAEYVGGVSENTNTGYAGTAYVNYDNAAGGYIKWTVNVATAGNYRVTFRYANGAADTTDTRACKVTVNGSTDYVATAFLSTGAWTTWSEVSVVLPLQAGANTIQATGSTSTGGPNMDYIELTATTDAASPMQKEPEPGAKQVENLNRGVIAVNTGKGILVSWRLLGTDDENTTFKVFRNGDPTVLYEGSAANPTCYLDSVGSASDWYTVDVYQGDTCTEFACLATMLGTNDSNGGYLDVKLDVPAGLTMPDGTTCTYAPNDCSVGDVDGDGQYELFVKWDPSNSQDNSKSGYTGNVYIDCYRLDGTKLWRVDLGRNIRAGAHYTQFMVYDFDGDSKAEMICKTSDGTVDGTGVTIGDGSADYRSSSGYILTGNEYLTLFDGATGQALDTVDYVPGRGTVSAWGDSYGNRVDRFLGSVAYLDGATPPCVMVRGYYTRMTATAWDVENKKLVQRWAFDSDNSGSGDAAGDGNHNCFAADADGDGKDEIIMGACVIDDDGSLLYSTNLGHGDAMHIGDLVPSNPGLEIFMCHETGEYGISLRDAKTGNILMRKTGSGDTGRGLAANIIPGNSAAEFTGIHDSIIYNESGTQIATWADVTKWNMNSLVYWNGDLERDVLDRTMVDSYGNGRIFTASGCTYNNGSKSNAGITCDLFGDWREEMVFAGSTGDYLRIYSTSFTTDYAITTLMHNPQYRTMVAGQNVAYNQPPHLSYFLGTGFDIPENGAVYTTGQ